MKNKASNIWWRLSQALFIFLLNGGWISFFVMNFINYEQGDISFSYWDALANKAVFEIAKVTNCGWSFVDNQYHFYWKVIVYLVMIIGPIITFFFIKFLYKNQRQWKLTRLAKKDSLEQKIIEDKEIKELLAKAATRELSNSEKKKLEKLSKGD